VTLESLHEHIYTHIYVQIYAYFSHISTCTHECCASFLFFSFFKGGEKKMKNSERTCFALASSQMNNTKINEKRKKKERKEKKRKERNNWMSAMQVQFHLIYSVCYCRSTYLCLRISDLSAQYPNEKAAASEKGLQGDVKDDNVLSYPTKSYPHTPCPPTTHLPHVHCRMFLTSTTKCKQERVHTHTQHCAQMISGFG